MRRAGPLSTWAPGPARRILKMFISKKRIEGGDPHPKTTDVSLPEPTPVRKFLGNCPTGAALMLDPALRLCQPWPNLTTRSHQMNNSQGILYLVRPNCNLHQMQNSQGMPQSVHQKKENIMHKQKKNIWLWMRVHPTLLFIQKNTIWPWIHVHPTLPPSGQPPHPLLQCCTLHFHLPGPALNPRSSHPTAPILWNKR